MQFTFKVLLTSLMFLATTAQIGCSGSGNSNTTAAVVSTSSTGFFLAYGACFSAATNQPVDYSNCAGSGGGTVYTTSPGTPTVCCPSGTATSFADTGYGNYHGISINYPVTNCCTAWEGHGNGGSAGCRITCQ